MKFNFFKDYFKPKAYFIHKPKLIAEYKENGVVFYSMDSDLVFCTGKKIKGRDEHIVIKAIDESGATFYTNLVSSPMWLKRFLDYLSTLKHIGNFIISIRQKMIWCAALHDGIYNKPSFFQRLYGDWQFLLSMKVEDVTFIVRWLCFLAVRIFGSSYR